MGVEAFVHTTRYSLDIAPADMARTVADEPFSDDMESAKWKYYRHLYSLEEDDPALLEHAKVLGSSNSFLIPTMSLLYLDMPLHKNLWDYGVAGILDPADINNPANRKSGNHDYDSVTQANYTAMAESGLMIEKTYYREGAKYLAGSATDVWGTMPGISLHTELESLKKIGLSNIEVIAAATTNFNKAYGWKTGRIEKGFRANILVLNSNPLEDLANLQDIDRLILRGELTDREGLLINANKQDDNDTNGQNGNDTDGPDGKIVKRESIDLLSLDEIKENITDKETGELKPLFRHLGETKVEKIRYISDGLEVVAYMACPDKPGRYPGVIYNRGGNKDFGQITSIKLAHVLSRVASWGYVVVGSQYRGNDGGEGREEFGGKDINDVLNLIPLLKAHDMVNPDRLGIYGWSRGGMMTYLSLMQTSEFKAACVGGALSDLHMMMETRPGMEEVYIDLIPDYMENKKAALDTRSAIKNVEKITKQTPVLMLHGTSDWRVVPQMALDLAEEFTGLKVPYRLVMYEGGDHGLSEHDREMNEELKAWFDKYLKKEKELPDLEPHGR